MLHLFKHSDGKYDIALVIKGKYIVGSEQHYERKRGALNAILKIMDCTFFEGDQQIYTFFQDDTLTKPTVCKLLDTGKIIELDAVIKPSKPYIPKSRKK